MSQFGTCYTIKPVDPKILDHIEPINKTYRGKELFHLNKLLNPLYVDSFLLIDLLISKKYLHENYNSYKKYRDKIIPRTHLYQGKHYKYHTFIKLLQTFYLCGIDTQKIKSFYDICGAPGEWIRSLFNECPITKAYAISLNDNGIPYDEDIYYNKNLKIISPNDGNIYKIDNLVESLIEVDRVDLVCCDGGFNISKMNINESLQALALVHLILAEFVYGLCFTKIKSGIFICKIFDIFDDVTIQILMCATIFYSRVNIVKPKESRLVNGEKYLVCRGLEFNDRNVVLKNKLINLMAECQNSIPGEIFDKSIMNSSWTKDFRENLFLINNEMIKKQSKEIYRVVNLSIDKYK